METDQQEDKVKKKITQLILNTPDACFLCLQDDEEGPSEDLNGGIINLISICRYLNINQCSLLLTSLENDGGPGAGVMDVEQQLCSFSVKLCPKCLELTEKLNEMIIQLERVKLLVNFNLQSFHKVLEGNKKEEKLNINSDKSLEAKLVQLLREEVEDKSRKFLRKAEAAMPQVILSKCRIPPPAPPSAPPSTEPPPMASTSTSMKTLVSHLVATNLLPTPSESPNSKIYRCPYCFKILGASKFPLHLSSLHSDKLLSSHFPPSSSPPPSESLCRQVLHTKVIGKAEKIPASSLKPKSFPRWACHLCGLSFSNGNILKHHFLIYHTDKLCEEIKSFKNLPEENPVKVCKISRKRKSTSISPPPSPKKPEQPIKKLKTLNPVQKIIKSLLQTAIIDDPSSSQDNHTDNPAKFVKRYQCPFCRKSPVYSKFTRHLANRHPDKLLAPFIPTTAAIDKLKRDNPNYFSKLCRKVLGSQVKKIRKKDSDITSISSKLACHLCVKKYSEGQNLKHHFVVNHSDYLCEQLIKSKEVEDKKTKIIIKNDKPLKRRGRPLKDKSLKDKLIMARSSKYER